MIDPTRLIPARHRFVRAIRDWFDRQGFCEVETPYAVRSPGMEPHLQAFEVTSQETPETHRQLYLHTSPEYHMKRALARHQQPIFQLCRCFRDEAASRLHHPEFTMLEWYRADADYLDLMEDCEGLLAWLADTCLEGAPLLLPEGTVDLHAPFERLTVRDALFHRSGVDPFVCSDATSLAKAARGCGLDVPSHWPWEDAFHFLLLERVEEHLGSASPTFLYDYPPSLAALSRVVDGVAQRFELYVCGHELANAFSELVDPAEQRRRFLADQDHRESLGRPVYPLDEDLLDSLGQLPRSAGIALGVDRLWLLFAEHLLNRRLRLSDVLLFGL